MEMAMKRTILAGLCAIWAGAAAAQTSPPGTLLALRSIDADNYDPVRSTARSAGEVVEMMADTLVSVDWDMKTIKPGLAESWTVSPDGKLYTFRLRHDVTFCDGKPMTADDVVYSINRLADPATHSPVRWRAGSVKEVRAPDKYTVEYELNQPFSELLFQLSLFFASVVDKATVEKLGANFGSQGFNGTGPFCWVSWTPRSDLVLRKHEGYVWGPPIFKNPSPQVDRVIWRVIPDDNTRMAALQSGQGDVTQYIPYFQLDALKHMPNIHLSNQPNYFWDYFLGFKINKPVVDDPVLRRAMVMAVNRAAIAKAVFFGAGDPADSYLNPATLDYDPKSKALLPAFDPAAARKLLDDNGWKPGADNIREKDGVRASFTLYGLTDMQWTRATEAMQADLRRVGIEMKIQLWDATIGWGKLATQDFDAFVMSYPYVSAGDALNLYFQSTGTPTPNRMNWKDGDTDKWLLESRSSTDPVARAQALANVQEKITENNVWIPLVREQLWVASSARTQGVRAHGLYGIGIYKGLDITLTK
jgi:peptide/nickel transport system substrate-binding protein